MHTPAVLNEGTTGGTMPRNGDAHAAGQEHARRRRRRAPGSSRQARRLTRELEIAVFVDVVELVAMDRVGRRREGGPRRALEHDPVLVAGRRAAGDAAAAE